ncbi:hypothetical protein L228DRAFT_171314 [Xylona heveae TC161]|uniref:Uncharacterized protein n=1 Tax=Xylona heveae (strain CBS 132557 / TC161) TaxID=1328760 RepID=A0A165FTZ3_XYLHT|nr:hypothetical protein L228DRAFT_171314 [Xylona heveae TC161]KZF21376.1 hypothetical protein L228DRAFT_171314 [Xylona heveae TC161]
MSFCGALDRHNLSFLSFIYFFYFCQFFPLSVLSLSLSLSVCVVCTLHLAPCALRRLNEAASRIQVYLFSPLSISFFLFSLFHALRPIANCTVLYCYLVTPFNVKDQTWSFCGQWV